MKFQMKKNKLLYYMNNKNFKVSKLLIEKNKESIAIIKQEKWRQKQIDIYFLTGRPIYGKYYGSVFKYI